MSINRERINNGWFVANSLKTLRKVLSNSSLELMVDKLL